MTLVRGPIAVGAFLRTGMLGIVAIACLACFLLAAKRQYSEVPYGCDSFGYLRQAQLFRTHGWLDGLDTRVQGNETRFLIETAKRVQPNSNLWSDSIAPHCHHYVARTDAVILQYPPGTGLWLSLFPIGRAVNLLYLSTLFVFVASFAFAATRWSPATSRNPIAQALLWTGSLVAGVLLFRTDGTMGSYSVPASLALAELAACACIAAFPWHARPNVLASAILGVVCGLLVLTRIANVFFVGGLAVFAAVRLFPRRSEPRALASLAAGLSAFCFAGVLPLFRANWINAGGMLATTYAPTDASPPRLDLSWAMESARFYLFGGFAAPMVIAALLLLGVAIGRVAFQVRRRQPCPMLAATLAATAGFGLSVLYFFLHPVRISYYLYPCAAFVVFLLVVSFLEERSEFAGAVRADRSAWRFLVFVPLICVFLIKAERVPLDTNVPAMPAPALAPDAIVWADLIGGTILYYNDKYTAKLNFANACMQRRIAKAISESGRPQFVVEDTKAMVRMVESWSDFARFERVGNYEIGAHPNTLAEPEVLRVEIRPAANASC